MDFTQLLNSGLGQQIISGIGNQVGTSEKDTSSVIGAAFPVLLGMLQKNASSEDGASGIMNALKKHDGSILDNLSGFLNMGDTTDGNGILGHILGGNKSNVENAISQKTGVGAMDVAKIIAMLAPIVMGYLGRQTRNENVSNSGGLGSVLGGILGNAGSSSSVSGGILTSILDQDGDGQLGVGDVLSAVSGKQKKSGFLGGLLGSIFGRK
ncbi:MAG: DUF937 domain-containing protein [Saprospiraceae bacterium]|nr:DUF937 domain-containing protein [Saprospiraceae bacterium]